MWRRFAKGGQSGANIDLFLAKPAINALAVAHSAPIEAEDRKPLLGQRRCQSGLPGKGTAADFVAACHEQQACRLFALIERSGKAVAFA